MISAVPICCPGAVGAFESSSHCLLAPSSPPALASQGLAGLELRRQGPLSPSWLSFLFLFHLRPLPRATAASSSRASCGGVTSPHCGSLVHRQAQCQRDGEAGLPVFRKGRFALRTEHVPQSQQDSPAAAERSPGRAARKGSAENRQQEGPGLNPLGIRRGAAGAGPACEPRLDELPLPATALAVVSWGPLELRRRRPVGEGGAAEGEGRTCSPRAALLALCLQDFIALEQVGASGGFQQESLGLSRCVLPGWWSPGVGRPQGRGHECVQLVPRQPGWCDCLGPGAETRPRPRCCLRGAKVRGPNWEGPPGGEVLVPVLQAAGPRGWKGPW